MAEFSRSLAAQAAAKCIIECAAECGMILGPIATAPRLAEAEKELIIKMIAEIRNKFGELVTAVEKVIPHDRIWLVSIEPYVEAEESSSESGEQNKSEEASHLTPEKFNQMTEIKMLRLVGYMLNTKQDEDVNRAVLNEFRHLGADHGSAYCNPEPQKDLSQLEAVLFLCRKAYLVPHYRLPYFKASFGDHSRRGASNIRHLRYRRGGTPHRILGYYDGRGIRS